jgi:membrane protease YdiL (CAAX protease family)
MPSVIQFIFTVVFGFLWWWVYNRVGAALEYLVILGSVLAVCVCCCRTGVEPHREWSFDRYRECIRRCWLVTVVLMFSLFILAIVVVWVASGAFPGGAALVNMLIAAIGAPLFVRLICCAYES